MPSWKHTLQDTYGTYSNSLSYVSRIARGALSVLPLGKPRISSEDGLQIKTSRETLDAYSPPQVDHPSRCHINEHRSARSRSDQQQRFDSRASPPHKIHPGIAQEHLHRPFASEHRDEHAWPAIEHTHIGSTEHFRHSFGVGQQRLGGRAAASWTDSCGGEDSGNGTCDFGEGKGAKREESGRSSRAASWVGRRSAANPGRTAKESLPELKGTIFPKPARRRSSQGLPLDRRGVSRTAIWCRAANILTAKRRRNREPSPQSTTRSSLISSHTLHASSSASNACSPGFGEQEQARRAISWSRCRRQSHGAALWLPHEDEAGLDGAQDEGEDVKGARRSGRVRGLVGKWEERTERASRGEDGRRVKERWKGRKVEESEVPIVYPLHVNKFVRRSSSGTPVRPQSPLYLPGLGEETVMHAPRPHRSIPSLQTPMEDASLLSPRARRHITPVEHLHGTRRHCIRHGRRDHVRQDLQGRAKAFAGTKDMLSRSRTGAYIPTGQMERRQMEATSPWMAPIDPFSSAPADVLMGHVDACPDCLQELDIKRREAHQADDHPEANCMAVRRDVRNGGGSSHTVKRPNVRPTQHLFAPASHVHSTEVEDAMDSDPLAPPTGFVTGHGKAVHDESQAILRDFDQTWRSTPSQQTRSTLERRPPPGQMSTFVRYEDSLFASDQATPRPAARRNVTTKSAQQNSCSTDDMDDLVVSRPLRDGLNAVVVEHEGHLRRVILNRRRDLSEVERLQQLSRELASVSNSLAFVGVAKGQRAKPSGEQISVVLDKAPTPPRHHESVRRPVRTESSIPALLSMIDQAASEIHINSNKISDHYVNNRRQSLASTFGRAQSLMYSDEMHDELFDLPSPGQQMAHRQGMDEAINAAQEKIAVIKTAPARERPRRSVPEVLTMAMSAKRHSVEKKHIADPRVAVDAVESSTEENFPMKDSPPPKPDDQAKLPIRSSAKHSTTTPARKSFTTSARPVPTVVTTRPSKASLPPGSYSGASDAPPSPTSSSSASSPKPTTSQKLTRTSPTAPDKIPAAAPPIPTSRALEPSHSHSYFSDLLHFKPFHRRTPQPSSTDDPTADSTTAIDPLVAAAKAAVRPTITAHPSPYRHAPAAPQSLFFAEHVDAGVLDRAKEVKAAMRKEKVRAVQEAAAVVEREVRRARRESAGGGQGKVAARKGWFG